MSKIPIVMVAAVAMSLSATFAQGADPNPSPDVQERAERALREGAEKVMRALELMLQAVPQYAAPEVLDNGDIIIRRRHPEKSKPPEPPEYDDETNT